MAYKGCHIPELVTGIQNSGEPLASGKVYIYDVGTANEKTVYSDVACTVAISQPIVLDAQGRSLVYMKGIERYKMKVDTSADVNVFTYDDLGVTMDGTTLKLSEADVTGKYVADLVDGGGDVPIKPKIVYLKKGTDIASANALTPTFDGNYFDVTGTTNITSIATSGVVGTTIKLHFDAALTISHHATDLILPNGTDITTVAGDEFEFTEYASGDWRVTGGTSYLLSGHLGAQGYRTADLSLTTNTTTVVPMTNQNYDTSAFLDPSTGERFTIPSGVNVVSALGQLYWQATASQATSPTRQLEIRLNGSLPSYPGVALDYQATSASLIQQVYMAPTSVSAGDYLGLYALHNIGTTLDVLGGADPYLTIFTVWVIS